MPISENSGTVVLASGGLDSTTALAEELALGHEVTAVCVHYGQRHQRELDAVHGLSVYYGISYVILDLQGVTSLISQRGGALLGQGDVPEGHYAAATMARTIVPGRNLMLISAAACYAQTIGAARLVIGVHAGDHPVYPDCRPGFVRAAQAAVAAASEDTLELHAPYVGMSKADIVRRGSALAVPYKLTWSCYQGGAVHCGRCGTCVERAEAFAIAEVEDPTAYVDAGFWRTAAAKAL